MAKSIVPLRGRPSGNEDGYIRAQKGEYVIKKAAVKKLGTKVLDSVNRGVLPGGKGKTRKRSKV